jgi:hypothetical protein
MDKHSTNIRFTVSLKVENSHNNISLEEARALVCDPNITDKQLQIIIDDLKILCEVASYLYKKENAKRAA